MANGNMFTDKVKITIKSGDGGDGMNSFKSYKGKPACGPDGGDGGNGVNIYIVADTFQNTLRATASAAAQINASAAAATT